MRTLVLR